MKVGNKEYTATGAGQSIKFFIFLVLVIFAIIFGIAFFLYFLH